MTDDTDAATDRGTGPADDTGPAPQGATDDESIVDLAQQPVVKAWTKFVGALFALVGFGIGLAMILLDAVDESMFEIDATGFGEMGLQMMMLPPEQAVFWAVVLGGLVGVYVGWSLTSDDTTTMLVAAISSFVGTIALLIVSAILTSVALGGISVDFGGLVIISIVASIAVAVVAAGSVWLARNQSPAEHAGSA